MPEDGDSRRLLTPLAGVILCCTDIPPDDRAKLAVIGAQMGAIHKLDLTSDVTHLIAGSTESKKYEYVARFREDVKVVTPEWLEAVRQQWLEGTEVDVAELERKYRVLPFSGYRICVTGFTDPDVRRYMQEEVIKNGAEYHGDLTRHCTHLIAAAPVGGKYEHACNWGLTVVSFEWFKDCLERGMVLDPSKYDPTLPPEERGKGAWERRQKSASPKSGKRTWDSLQAQQALDPNPNRRKLRRSASTRVGSQSQSLWAGITAGGQEKQTPEEDDWADDLPKQLPSDVPTETERSSVVAPPVVNEEETPVTGRSSTRRLKNRGGIFEGRLVFIQGFSQKHTDILCQHLTSNNAVVVLSATLLAAYDSEDFDEGFSLTPHNEPFFLNDLPSPARKMTPVTELWVEQCIYTKRLVDPTEKVLYRPFKVAHINGFEDLTINSTAFAGIELLHVVKVATLMGAKYDEFLRDGTSVLICNTDKPKPEKLQFVNENHIPLVHSAWLWDCIEEGKMQPFDKYFLQCYQPQGKNPKSQPKKVNPANYSEIATVPVARKPGRPPLKPRRGLTRSGTLDLSATVEDDAEEGQNTHSTPEDYEDGLGYGVDGHASAPLQELPAEVNSPHRRPSAASSAARPSSSTGSRSTSEAPAKHTPRARVRRNSKVHKESTPDEAPPAENSTNPSSNSNENKPDSASLMLDLLARRKAASTANTGAPSSDEKRRRRKALGRAPSNMSNPGTAPEQSSTSGGSAPGSFTGQTAETRTVVETVAVVQKTTTETNLKTKENPTYAETRSSALDADTESKEPINTSPSSSSCNSPEPDLDPLTKPPSTTGAESQFSQSLLYEDPDVALQREEMIRQMGGTVHGAGMVVERVGTVKDVVFDARDAGGVGRAEGYGRRRGRRAI